MLQPRGIGFSREGSVAANDRISWKISGEIQAVENAACRVERFVGEHRERGARPQLAQHTGNPLIRPRVCEEPCVVDREKTIERVGRRRNTCGRKCARDERRRAVADHPADSVRFERLRATGDEHGIDGFGNVAARVDEGAVQVEHDEAKHENLRI